MLAEEELYVHQGVEGRWMLPQRPLYIEELVIHITLYRSKQRLVLCCTYSMATEQPQPSPCIKGAVWAPPTWYSLLQHLPGLAIIYRCTKNLKHKPLLCLAVRVMSRVYWR